MADYYVTSAARGGADGNAGTIVAPWETVSKVNGSSFSAGDTVNFDRGVAWREQVTFPSSGSSGNRIIIRSYGTGNTSVLSGFDVMSGFTDGGSNIWDKSSVTTQPLGCIINGAFRKKMAASRAACTTAGDWYWETNTLSVYATSNPSGNVEAGQRTWAFHTNGKNFLHIIDIVLTGGNGGGGMVVSGGPSDVKIETVVINLNPGVGIQLNAGTTGVAISSCTITDNGAVGILVLNTPAATNFSLLNSIIRDNGWRNLSAGNNSGMLCWIESGEIAYNIFDANGAEATSESGTEHGLYQGAVDNCTMDVHHNTIIGHTKGFGIKTGSSGTLRYNTLDGNRGGIAPSGNGSVNMLLTCHHNTIINTMGSAFFQNGKGAGTMSVLIYQNTVYNCETSVFGVGGGIDFEADLTEIDLRNNIFSVCGSTQMIFFRVAQTGTVKINYNCVYHPSEGTPWRVASNNYDFAGWQGLGYDANGINTNPLFVNAAGGDFHLRSDSPCIDTGVLIPGINT